ncbi:MAG: ACT domain-containing protein [Anaerolineae bacterium]|nr:ACT domain-containing protein [Anaerolineae bacterium]
MPAKTVAEALQQAELYSDDYLYCFIKLPANAVVVAASIVAETNNPFTALLVDKDEVTLMLEEEDYGEYQRRLLDAEVSEIRYRLITFDIELAPTMVGFMATISAALAEAGISLMPFAAYSRDHIFVNQRDYEKTIAILNTLKGTQSA